jgi:uncharacterized protein (DUF1778 family)
MPVGLPRRTKSISLKMSESEHQLIVIKAEMLGLSVSELLISSAISTKTVPVYSVYCLERRGNT